MNKQFLLKLLQAKQMEYQAFKELVPPILAQRIDIFEKELTDLAREFLAGADHPGTSGPETEEKGSRVRKVNIG